MLRAPTTSDRELVPTITRPRIALVASLTLVAFGAPPMRAQTPSSKAAPTVTFEADLSRATATAHAPFKAGGASWSCSTTHCTGKGPGNDPASTCSALVKHVGPLKNFTAAGKGVDMKACNGVTPAMSLMPRPGSLAIDIDL